jgi:hypothetical protein
MVPRYVGPLKELPVQLTARAIDGKLSESLPD